MKHLFSGSLVLLLLLEAALATPGLAQGQVYRLTVDAGKHDRDNTPMCILLIESNQQANQNPVLLDEARSVRLADQNGNQLPAQLTAPGVLHEPDQPGAAVIRELHFVLPSLEKGETLSLTATLSEKIDGKLGKELGEKRDKNKSQTADTFAWNDTSGKHAELSFGARPVLRYMYEPLDESTPQARERTYKVFHHLYDPTGTHLVTKGAGGKFTHHRGLFFGFNRISYGETRLDTWHCKPPAYLSHEGFLAEEAGPVLGRHLVAVDWHGPTPPGAFATERRQMTVYHVPGGQMVEFATRLTSTQEKIKLDGDPQHAGFQFRASQEVADGDQKLTYYLRPDGKGEPGDTRNWDAKARRPDCVNLPFNAMSFVTGGQRYTAVYLDHPTNPKEARYSERTYGRFGSYFEYELDEVTDLKLNYRLWLQEGEMTLDQVETLRADFVEPPRVIVQ